MKLRDSKRGSATAYREAVKIVREQIDFELEPTPKDRNSEAPVA